MCRQCPRRPNFHSWFFHIQGLARQQAAGIQFTRRDLSEAEVRGLAIWNTFHDTWKAIGYKRLDLPESVKPKDEEDAF